ncbi:IclR family transcriptional regulator C-terminal domain-containing protein [Streptomyces sp. NPDC090106]|uniref:IclR family transcriptional regulator domain-containing protein n=1 Tax=Streptomyces sp. NPDC090106 TaxID=3365946 RepID=UPI0037F790BD
MTRSEPVSRQVSGQAATPARQQEPTDRPAAPRPPEQRGEHFLESLERGLLVLRSFDARHPRRTLTEVAEATGLNRATARRILLTLSDLGYVSQSGRDFSLAPRVLDFGFSYLANLGVTAAEPYMRELSRQVGESVLLAVLDGHDVRYVARANAPRTLHLNIPIGERSPAHVTSAGRMLLAQLPPAELDHYLATAELRQYTDWTVTDQTVLRAQLAEAARRGWAHSVSELDVGMEGVAVPLPGLGFDGTPTALSAVFPVMRFDFAELEEKVVAPLREQAEHIAQTAARHV